MAEFVVVCILKDDIMVMIYDFAHKVTICLAIMHMPH
jgi:hypothetical protein